MKNLWQIQPKEMLETGTYLKNPRNIEDDTKSWLHGFM